MSTKSGQRQRQPATTAAARPAAKTTDAVAHISSARSKAPVRSKSGSDRPGRKSKKVPVWLVVAGLIAVVWLGLGFYLLFWSGGGQQPGSQQPVATLQTPDVHSLAFSSTSDLAITVYFGSHNGLLKSSDAGRTWQATSLKNQDAMNTGISRDGQTMYVGGHDVFLKSVDGGQSWRQPAGRLPGSDIHAMTVDPANPQTVFAVAVGVGLMKTEDGGQTWQIVSSANQLGPTTAALTYGNNNSNTLWAATADRGILRSQDSGISWQAASGFANGALNPNNRITALAFDAQNGMLYAGATDGLYHSMDGGNSWNRLNSFKGSVAALAINPATPKNLMLVTPQGQIFRSSDSGVSWPGK